MKGFVKDIEALATENGEFRRVLYALRRQNDGVEGVKQ